MQHPLLPLPAFARSQCIQELAQAACVATSLGNGILFFVSEKVAQVVVFHIPPLVGFLNLPSSVVYQITNNNVNMFNKISWIAPLSTITAVSLTAYKLYAISSSILVHGAICGAHSIAMTLFTYTAAGDTLGIITLRGSLKSLIWDANRFAHLGELRLQVLSRRAQIAASLAFIVSSVSLTIILQNPILANTVAYSLAPVVNVVAMRVLAAFG